MERRPAPAAHTFRPTWIEISADALRHNIRTIKKKLFFPTRLLAVVKADAYGHGAPVVAHIAVSAGAAYLGVSSVEEGIILRRSGIRAPILILGSQYPFSSFDAVAAWNLLPTVASRASGRALSAAGKRKKKTIPFHFKVDTGMGRIGVQCGRACETIKNLVRYPYSRLEGIYTHFASADADRALTMSQLKQFQDVRSALIRSGTQGILFHAANSAAAGRIPSSRMDMVRIGLALYGLGPVTGKAYFSGLKPVLSWKTKIVFLKWLTKGAPVSYGGTYRARRRTKVATLPVGYADGYDRKLSNNAFVLIRGRRCPVIGRVTMDMIMVDVTLLKKAVIGDTAVLAGTQGTGQISVEELARRAGTVSYEIVCGISARVPRNLVG